MRVGQTITLVGNTQWQEVGNWGRGKDDCKNKPGTRARTRTRARREPELDGCLA